MDLYIQTLTGSAFELRVSPFETVMSVKAKIQRLEGIPISQQHLIWRSVELEDDYCLHDYNITDGTTLQLVLAMRGGPINTRRIPVEDPTLREMAEYMEANRDEIWDKLPKDNRQVTLLVYREGDQLNFFRVVDRGDGTLTPLSDSLSGASMYNLYDEEDEDAQQPVISQETLKENSVTMDKMKSLKMRMQTQKDSKPSFLQPRPPSTGKPLNSTVMSARRRLHLGSRHHHATGTTGETSSKYHSSTFRETDYSESRETASAARISDRVYTNSRRVSTGRASEHVSSSGRRHSKSSAPLESAKRTSAAERPTQGPLPPVTTKKSSQIDVSDFLVQKSQEPRVVQPLNHSLTRSAFKEGRRALTELVKDSKEIKPIGSISKSKGSYREGRSSSPQVGSGVEHSSASASIRRSRIPEEISHISFTDVPSSGARHRRVHGIENRISTPEGRGSTLLNDSFSFSHLLHSSVNSSSNSPGHHLPPVKGKPPPPPPQLVPSKKRTRCFSCGKKTGLATTYQCRCGNSFCATHRYAEVHNCTYDYKSEGRKLIQQNNPVVAAPKLPKI